MSEIGAAVLACLSRVARQRALRAADHRFSVAVRDVKRFQQERFRSSYADFLSGADTADAARFFLEKLYGPQDFAERDRQFARVVPALSTLFSGRLAQTLLALAQLHAISEELDSAMGQAVQKTPVDSAGYRRAWRSVGQHALREQQVEFLTEIGRDLELLVRKPLLRRSLSLTRGPAVAAGFAELQDFLESGFRAFSKLKDPGGFLLAIASHERAVAAELFGD